MLRLDDSDYGLVRSFSCRCHLRRFLHLLDRGTIDTTSRLASRVVMSTRASATKRFLKVPSALLRIESAMVSPRPCSHRGRIRSLVVASVGFGRIFSTFVWAASVDALALTLAEDEDDERLRHRTALFRDGRCNRALLSGARELNTIYCGGFCQSFHSLKIN